MTAIITVITESFVCVNQLFEYRDIQLRESLNQIRLLSVNN